MRYRWNDHKNMEDFDLLKHSFSDIVCPVMKILLYVLVNLAFYVMLQSHPCYGNLEKFELIAFITKLINLI